MAPEQKPSRPLSALANDLSNEDRHLIAMYERFQTPLDYLVYTDDFDRLVEAYKDAAKLDSVERVDVFRRLMTLRKRGQLPRLVRAG